MKTRLDALAGSLRKRATKWELALFQELRRQSRIHLGVEPHFQVPITGKYIVDIWFGGDLRTAVEVDGRHHRSNRERFGTDILRTDDLNKQGIRVIRIANAEIVKRGVERVARHVIGNLLGAKDLVQGKQRPPEWVRRRA